MKTAIIGGGLAGLTSAIYLSRANLNPTVYAGSITGGQIMLTHVVENYPGFPEGILGPDLIQKLTKQAQKFDANIIYKDVLNVDFSKKPFTIFTDEGSEEYDGVIIATGSSAKWLGLESEQKLIGRGVSSCATCDGAFFKDKVVAVVGGGDTAMEESIFLTSYASKIYLLHRRDKLRASKIMQQRVMKEPKIEILFNTHITEVLGTDKVEGIKVISDGEEKTLDVAGLFLAIGYTPNTKIFEGQIELDEIGYIKVHDKSRTNIEGVFSAGDVDDFQYRQAITAAAEGCKAAIDLEKFIQGIQI